MKETLTYNWVTRTLIVEVVNETSRPTIKYSERAVYEADPENDACTIKKLTGYSDCDIPLMMSQFGDDMCKDIYNYNFQRNCDADSSLLQVVPAHVPNVSGNVTKIAAKQLGPARGQPRTGAYPTRPTCTTK